MITILDKIWGFMMVAAVICAAFNSRLDTMTSALMQGIKTSAEFIISFTFTMCFWNGIMQVAQKSGLVDVLSKLFAPFMKAVFPNVERKSDAYRYMTMNMSANLLGLGNAATPMGIKAMKELQSRNPLLNKPSDDMVNLVIINTASITLLPTTLAMIRQQAGAENPMDILPGIVISSVLALTLALGASKIFKR